MKPIHHFKISGPAGICKCGAAVWWVHAKKEYSDAPSFRANEDGTVHRCHKYGGGSGNRCKACVICGRRHRPDTSCNPYLLKVLNKR